MMNKILFDSFNARYLSFEEIVDSFVSNKQYEDLKLNNHSLLMGPRGSGKTTLLKMLSPICQYIINQENPKDIPFWGVYIPTDIQWKRQIEYFEENTLIEERFKNLISKTIIRTNIQIALIKTIYSILDINNLHSEDDSIFQYNFCKKLIEAWAFNKNVSPDLDTIEFSLRNRLTEINSIINKIDSQSFSINEYKWADYFYHDYLDVVKVACFLFESIYRNHLCFITQNFRWALCFDELEIAPIWLQNDLLDKLRSSEQNIIFKLTTSPLVSLNNKINKSREQSLARQEEDYKIIRTWICKDYDNNNWTSFCRKLVEQKLAKRGGVINPDQLFGKDILERNLKITFPSVDDKNTSIRSYEKGSIHWYVFRELALVDKSFSRYLENKGIKPLNPIPIKEGQIDSVFRKIKPIVIFRYQLRGETRRRSRKNVSLYYGVPFLYELCDGNPRALMAILDIFLSNVKLKKNGDFLPFNINVQSKIITQFSENYLKLITAHPDANTLIRKGNYSNLGDIITIIGRYFNRVLIMDPFTSDPFGSFVVDDKVPQQIIQLIELGVQLGAIIYVNPEKVFSLNGIIGKKFRLSYLLHPYFKLPKREYQEIALSKITNQRNSELIKQTLLFES